LTPKAKKNMKGEPSLLLHYIIGWPPCVRGRSVPEKQQFLAFIQQQQADFVQRQLAAQQQLLVQAQQAQVMAHRQVIRDRLLQVLGQYRISEAFLNDLLTLVDFNIVMVLDDSGSMNTNVTDQSTTTRWDQLKQAVRIAIDIGTILDNDGIDILFLNRGHYPKVTSWEKVEGAFKRDPDGQTPLTEKCDAAFRVLAQGKKLLVLIATDGAPNNVQSFTGVIRARDPRIHIGFLVCSNTEADVEYLDAFDNWANIDVLNTYETEYKQVYGTTLYPNYTYGDHIARFFLGPVLKKYDLLDGK
jgi:hypothetical protein